MLPEGSLDRPAGVNRARLPIAPVWSLFPDLCLCPETLNRVHVYLSLCLSVGRWLRAMLCASLSACLSA